MKYIKTYSSNTPKIGDYILFNDYIDQYTSNDDIKCIKFLSSHAGKITKSEEVLVNKGTHRAKEMWYTVKYENLPEDILKLFSKKNINFYFNKKTQSFDTICREDIKFFSPNKEDLEIYQSANKYNL